MTIEKDIELIEKLLSNTPNDWLKLTTHRLDIYNEKLAKTEFLTGFEKLYTENALSKDELNKLPTAYDYIRLGHPLSSSLEWILAKSFGLHPNNVISFSSKTMPVLAVLRKNLFDQMKTRICFDKQLPECFDEKALKAVYGYNFEMVKVSNPEAITEFNGSTVFISQNENLDNIQLSNNIDFHVALFSDLGSIIYINESNSNYISEIQHVRRRESIAMTPINCFALLHKMIDKAFDGKPTKTSENHEKVTSLVQNITATNSKVLVGSCGLSMQYAIMMGLIDDAVENHKEKEIKIIVPPNCYGGTNDQARRVTACLKNVEILDLHVDGDHNMVQSIDKVLNQVAKIDAVPFIIAEIPTNPRVEVPDLNELRKVLNKKRLSQNGFQATPPVFILDQTFCPNVQFLSESGIFSEIKTIAYVSGSKFPSGGKVTAGYGVANEKAAYLMDKIEKHLVISDNGATDYQIAILAEQLPSMNERIAKAYSNTREFVNFIEKVLPEAKINFVSEELAQQGFTPSVFSLDLPTKGETHEEREAFKRELNQKLIDSMISEIPNESKYCVSYGQLKGCYWTIPATSTQGTTKEADKDYIARVSVSGNLDLEKHKEVFHDFVKEELR